MTETDDRKRNAYHFDRHTAEYRHNFTDITAEMQQKCPVAWTDTYGGHFVAASHEAVFEIARAAEYVSNAYDPDKGLGGIAIPSPPLRHRAGFIEMDPPEQRQYRQALNPYLSPAAVSRWLPVIDEITRACLDEKIETGRIDFVDDLANIVPAVLTLGLLGFPLSQYEIYVEPTHASVYLKPGTPEMLAVREKQMAMAQDMLGQLAEIRAASRPGLVHGMMNATIGGETPPDSELVTQIALLIGGGFDTTTALTAHALEWLSENPSERTRLSADRDTLLGPATEEFLRFYCPAPGDGRTITKDVTLAGQEFKAGDRLYIAWAMANRDPSIFENPNEINLDREGNRHYGFGLGVHRCIGSNVARVVFKRMLTAVLDRMPDYVCDPAGTVHYDTTGTINGMKNLPATFTPGPRLGPGLAETIAAMQAKIDTENLAAPVAARG